MNGLHRSGSVITTTFTRANLLTYSHHIVIQHKLFNIDRVGGWRPRYDQLGTMGDRTRGPGEPPATFNLKVNIGDLSSSAATAYTLKISKRASFGALRQQVAKKVGRPRDVDFIVLTVVVQNYSSVNVERNMDTTKHANITASSGLYNSKLRIVPQDTDIVFATMSHLAFRHSGREPFIYARDRRTFSQVIEDIPGRYALEELPSERSSMSLPTSRVPGGSAEVGYGDGGAAPRPGAAAGVLVARQGAVETLTVDVGGELQSIGADGENASALQGGDAPSERRADGPGSGGGGGSVGGGSGSAGGGGSSSAGGGAAARAVFSEILRRSTVSGTVLLGGPTAFGRNRKSGGSGGGSSGGTSASWSFLRARVKGSDVDPEKAGERPTWAMTDGDFLW